MLRSLLRTFEDIVFSERFSAVDGVLQRIDPRVKFCCFIAFILTAVAARTVTSLIILFILVIILSVASRIPPRFFFLRTTLFIPIFAAMIASPLPFITPGSPLAIIGYDKYSVSITWEGIYKAMHFTFRIWVCVASLTLLVLTTRFSRLVHAMEKFKIPKIFVTMTAITYRFVFLFINESYRMVLAKEARTVKKEERLRIMRSLAHIISTLFIRAYERGERVYMAMTARGYTGEVKSMVEMRCGQKDWIFGFTSFLMCFTILLADFWFR